MTQLLPVGIYTRSTASVGPCMAAIPPQLVRSPPGALISTLLRTERAPPSPFSAISTRPLIPLSAIMLRSALLVVAAAAVAVVAARADDDPEDVPSPTGRGFDLAVHLSDVHLAVLNTTATAESAAEAKILIEEGCLPADGPPVRRLLKFSTTIRNDGDKDLVIGLPPHNRSRVTNKWEVRRQGGRRWHCWMGW